MGRFHIKIHIFGFLRNLAIRSEHSCVALLAEAECHLPPLQAYIFLFATFFLVNLLPYYLPGPVGFCVYNS